MRKTVFKPNGEPPRQGLTGAARQSLPDGLEMSGANDCFEPKVLNAAIRSSDRNLRKAEVDAFLGKPISSSSSLWTVIVDIERHAIQEFFEIRSGRRTV